jgi:hypothetical protein
VVAVGQIGKIIPPETEEPEVVGMPAELVLAAQALLTLVVGVVVGHLLAAAQVAQVS